MMLQLVRTTEGCIRLMDEVAGIDLIPDQLEWLAGQLHLDYPQLYVYMVEEILTTARARRTLGEMVVRAGGLIAAMQALEGMVSGVLRLSSHRAESTRLPVPDLVDVFLAGIPEGCGMGGASHRLKFTAQVEIPVAPVDTSWRPRAVRPRGIGRVLAVVD